LAALAAFVIAALAPGLGGADEIPDPGWVVAATSPTTNLADAQRVTVNVKARADTPIYGVQVRQCRLGETYAQRSDFLPTGGKCPNGPVSTSADTVVARGLSNGILQTVQTPEGATLTFRVGVGVAEWQATDGPPSRLTCDPTHDCALVVQVERPSGFTYVVIPIAFLDADPVAGCGGAAPGAITSGGSDRMSDAYGAWTRVSCSAEGATGAPTTGSFPSEGEALENYSKGALDLAYTAAGYNEDVGLHTTTTTPRESVATPLALNAAVIAVGGGTTQLTGDKAPYQGIKLTPAEVAAIFGGGIPRLLDGNLPYGADIVADNPQLKGALFISGQYRPVAPAKPEATSYYLTKYLQQFAPDDWTSRTQPPVARGASVSLALADPAFPDIDLYSGRAILAKPVNALSFPNNDGPLWVMTDLATASALGLTPVAIQNAAGEYVTPTAASLQAAAATMKPDSDGLLQPDLGATEADAHATAAAAYPLTYVEYALAPSEPLVDTTTCTVRGTSQLLLTKWLTYVTGDGQQQLPAGFAPLPPSLQESATAAIAKVGASPVTGPCASTVKPPGAVSGPGSAGNGGALATGAPTTPRGPTGLAGGPAAAVGAAAGSDSTKKETIAAVPAFAGASVPDTSGGIVALIGIVLVTSLAAWLTAGNRIGGVAFAGAGAGSTTAVARSRPPTLGLVLLWFGVVATGIGLVVYQLGPLLAQRDQHDLLTEYRQEVRRAANESSGLPGVQEVTKAPEPGAPVGVLEIGDLRVQAVAVEGVSSAETSKGPGHVPGTAGLGQPGNSAVVARRNGYGGTFGSLEQLRKGSRILVTTEQGQSVYAVRSVRHVTIEDGEADDSGSSAPVKGGTTTKAANTRADHVVTTDELYGPTDDDRLTLVTSGSRAFWNTSDAVVVVARMQGEPFAPRPQGGRVDAQTGTGGDSGAWAAVILSLLLYGGAIVASIFLYRRMRFRVAYVLTVAPLVALTVVTGETLSRLLPAWL
jgi:sortase A